MAASKSLPPRPSLESLRKQAKKLARDRSVSLRDAQLLLAREYGFAGWQDLTAEVSTRLGKGLEWAAAQARHIIHNNDVEGLKQLLVEYPALLAWSRLICSRRGPTIRSTSDCGASEVASRVAIVCICCSTWSILSGGISTIAPMKP